ncbi:hypothetical protein, partial [Neptunomonas phycophila]|uniref:hypothetical protein n=1 Tax=Neptunomonas phycophila TaxID=1572645 RepID=UPI000AD47DC2
NERWKDREKEENNGQEKEKRMNKEWGIDRGELGVYRKEWGEGRGEGGGRRGERGKEGENERGGERVDSRLGDDKPAKLVIKAM